MSDRADDRDWAIARLLFATHLPFLAMVWAVFAAAVLVLIIGIDLLGTVTRSVWDPAVSVVRWFALGYGVYLINRLLPVYVAHGRTRREFLRSVALFVVAAAAVVGGLLTIGFALEAVLYRVMDWPHGVEAERLFHSSGQYPLVLLSYWAMLVIRTTIGLLLGAGFYRSGGNELVAVVLALAMVVVTGYGIGFNGLPFVGAVLGVAEVPLAVTLALCLAGLLPGAAATWPWPATSRSATARPEPVTGPGAAPGPVLRVRCRRARGSWGPAGPPRRSPARSWAASGRARPASTSSTARPAASRPAPGSS
jgi:hypothetical protein